MWSRKGSQRKAPLVRGGSVGGLKCTSVASIYPMPRQPAAEEKNRSYHSPARRASDKKLIATWQLPTLCHAKQRIYGGMADREADRSLVS